MHTTVGSQSENEILVPIHDASDAELVRRWQSGVEKAGATLLRRHEPTLRRFFNVRFDESSEDLVQQTLLVCTRNVAHIQEAQKFPSYLLGVAKRVSFEHLRKKRVRTAGHKTLSDQPIQADETPSGAVSMRQRGSRLMRAIRDLPPDWQLAVVLHYWQGLSVAEVAQVQDVAEGTVKSWLARSRSKLKRRLAVLLPEPRA
ncbi:MAG: RNA polymerase sigma factor [Myxococcota bacterium]